ncbi:Leucine-rich repeat-containing protein 61 [Trichoplax sp. H2]|nr:Leucine-rich repeat-containing protein 61 [Trichoplax sp. H2]|eukprot:RDD46380.1 Leucine-rich repeat-containing protein 61 [Trichoplax sp. H2]
MVEKIVDGVLTVDYLKSTSEEFDVDSIREIILRRMGLRDITCVNQCRNVVRLVLSDNKIRNLSALDGLTELTLLNLSSNDITSLDGLNNLEKLTTLNLAGNSIATIEALSSLSNLKALTNLRLHDDMRGISNPVCQLNNYQSAVVGYCPNLRILNGEIIKGDGSTLFSLFREMDKKIDGKLY